MKLKLLNQLNNLLPIVFLLLATVAFSQTPTGTVAIDGTNTETINSIEFSVGNGTSFTQTSPSGNTNPVSGFSVEIEELNIAGIPVPLVASQILPTITNFNPNIGSTAIPVGDISIFQPGVTINHRNTGQSNSPATNNPPFFTALENVLTIPDMRSYYNIGGGVLSGPFADVNFVNPITANDIIIVSERDGNTPIQLQALDASGNVITNSNQLDFGSGDYTWNTAILNSQDPNTGQTQQLVAISGSLFYTPTTPANSVRGIKIIQNDGADGKVVLFRRSVDLSVDINTSAAVVEVGDQVTFTITVNNLGDLTANNAIVDASLPTGFDFVSSNTNGTGTYNQATGVWSMGNLAGNSGPFTLTITASVNTSANPVNTMPATVSSNSPDIDLSNNEDSVVVNLDSDSDGIPDVIDIDDDNDGILDISESGGIDPLQDNDNDGIPAFLDDNDNDDQIFDDNNAIESGFDFDGDGVINALDLDSDNDGIPDNIEAQSTLGYTAPSPTGLDDDGDGLDNAYDSNDSDTSTAASVGLIAVDTDNDGTPDYLDLDADNDGVFDVNESLNPELPNDGNGQLTGVFGGNGLIAALEASDDYADVNGTFDDSQDDNFIDDDNDVNTGGDVDYRDTLDTDGDGVPNNIDIDDDNDGIPDGADSNGNDPDGDEDGDGIVNYIDTTDDGNNGDSSTTDYTDADNNGIPDVYDTDGDGIPNHLDLDSDNDGITDVQETRGALTIDPDPDNDGIIGTGPITDVDGDGLDDAYDNIDSGNLSGAGEVTNGDPLIVPNNDADSLPDFLDIDADNDGIPDNVEAQTTAGWIAPSGVGAGITDTNNNGVDDNYEDIPNGEVGTTPVNFDGTDDPDYLDSDSDNDGILDIFENGDSDNTLSGNDADGDGLDDNFDDNNDSAIAGSTVNDNHNPPAAANLGDADGDSLTGGDVDYRDALDTDADGIPDFTDIDDDNDGILDINEVPSEALADNDNDGIPAYLDDNDNDNTIGDDDNAIQPGFDDDGDGIINNLDLDTDNDGIPDNIEAQSTTGYIAATPPSPTGFDDDGDGLDNAYDLDDNNTSTAASVGLIAVDTDSDGTPDYKDIDSDNDGFFDIDESGDNLPSDGNGRTTGIVGNNGLDDTVDNAGNDNYFDVNGKFDNTQADNFTDADNDVNTTGDVDYRDTVDTDGDGVPDVDDIDDDNDGIPDLVETGGIDPLQDLDNDGIPAYLDDNDNDNTVGNDDNATEPAFDKDGDGIPNHLDLDSDNDGITDIRENGGIDTNNDGEVDYPTAGDPTTMVDVDGDGLDDELDNVDSGNLSGNGEVTNGTPLTIANNDGDSLPDYLDIDADNDGIPDNVEAQTTAGWIAPSGIGTAMTDSNNNGVDDNYEIGSNVGFIPVNFDNVDDPDYLDADSDNDGTPDIQENGNINNVLSNTDTDGDGLDDNFDDNDDSAIAGSTVNDDHNPPAAANLGDADGDSLTGGDVDYRDALDTDGDGVPDFTDIDDDNDGILDVDECDLTFTAGSISAVTDDNSVGNFARILNQTDDDGAEFNDTGDVLVVSFGTTLTPGSTVTLRVQNNNTNSTNALLLQQATSGTLAGSLSSASNPLTITGFPDDNTGWAFYTYTIAGSDATHLRISMPVDGGQTTDIDYVDWNRLDCDANGDTDGDGIPNSLDLDSDNDGIPDNIEAQSTLGYTPATPFAPTGFDDDGDGLDNAYDSNDNDTSTTASVGLIAVDTDGDGFPDFTDLDSDEDGIFDIDESNGLTGAQNDGNGQIPLTENFGENGLLNSLEATDNYADVNGTFDDTQGDNFTDADNDVNVSGGDVDYRDTEFTPDTDGDGVLDVVDLDKDNDGISDAVEGFVGCPSTDTTFESLTSTLSVKDPDPVSFDSLFDGIITGQQVFKFDKVQIKNLTGTIEIFNIGFADPVALTSITIDMETNQTLFRDRDLVYSVEGFDGTAWNVVLADVTVADATTLGEVWTINFLSNTTAYENYRILWKEGQDDDQEIQDKWVEEVSVTVASCTPASVDTDGDGIPDHLDSDSDNDGIADVIEAGGTDPDNDGYIGTGAITDVDGDGFDDSVDNEDGGNQSGAGEITTPTSGNPIPLTNTDGDSFPDHLDIDSDNDGIVDVIESQPTIGYIAPTGLDTDGDGIDDAFDPDQGGSFTNVLEDTDGDTTPDYLDLDSDDDGESDTIEAYDTNGDGVADTVPANADADNDGLDDNFDNFDLGTDTGNANGDNVNQEATFPFPVTIDSFFGEDADWRLVEYIQTTDGDWNVPANWSNDLVPGQEDNAIIDADVASYLTTDQPVNNLLLRSGSTVSIPDGAITLTVVGDIENNGDFTLYNVNQAGTDANVPVGTNGNPNVDGEVLLNGPATQTLSGTGNYYNLRVDNSQGVTISNPNTNDPLTNDPTEINGILYVDNGVFSTNDNVLFPCFFEQLTAGDFKNGRAGQIGPILGSASISGDVTVEQCYPGRRAYRYVSASTTTSTSIHDNWQEGADAYDDIPVASTTQVDISVSINGIDYGFGTHITGVVPDPNQNAVGQENLDQTNGLDWQPSGNASMFEFNEATQGFDPVLVTEPATLTAGKAYNMIIRGSREVDLTLNGSPTSNTKLRSTGTAVKGDYTYNSTVNDEQYMFVGNPFHAIVDMRKVVYGSDGVTGGTGSDADNPGLNRFIYAFDPTLGGNSNDANENSGVGALEGDRGAFITIDLQGVFPPDSDFSGSEMSHFLQAYQGFFIQAIQNTPTIVFSEDDKAVGQEQIDVFSTSTDMVSLTLYDQVSYDNNSTPDDFTVIKFGQNENSDVDYDDALKFTNQDENIGRLEANSYLTYENREMPQIGEVLELYTFNYRTTDYTFVVKVDGLLDNTVSLYDNYLNTDTVLNNDMSTAISFTVDPANPASTDPYRFELRFATSTLGTTEFDLEGISVYPNPASDILNINLGDNTGRFESLELYDITGRLVTNKNLSNQDLDIQMNVDGLSTGVYVLKVSSGNEQFSTKVIKQ